MIKKAGELMVTYTKLLSTDAENVEALTFMVRNAEVLVLIAQAHYAAANVRGRA